MATHTGTDEKAHLSRPMSVEQIVKEAQNFDYNPFIPLRYWLRTAGSLLKEADIYEHEGNDQQTYLLLFRHAQLVLGNLSSHPEARQTGNRVRLAEAEKEVSNSLAKLEILKPRINKRYERYEQLIRDRDARKAAARSVPSVDVRRVAEGHNRALSEPAVAASTDTIAAEDNRDLAIRLAHTEIKRRAVARKATRQAGISEEEEQERRAAGVWGNWEEAVTKDDEVMDHHTLSRQMQNVRLQVDGSKRPGLQNSATRLSYQSSSSTYQYPKVPVKSAYERWDRQNLPSTSALQPALVPERPHKEPLPSIEPPSYDEPPPPTPQKPSSSYADPPTRSATASPFQPDAKVASFTTFKHSAYLENGTPLRTIFLPPTLRDRFLDLARFNTLANLETCGILCGTLIRNALFISKLVIPDQESTSDTCETVDESALFDYCDGEDLMVLGWIHTHPTQTCFMSSRDLHTHCGYQVMMPESIAIVCAPSKYPDWGIFRLTDPPGMKAVLNCQQKGLFHPHAESNIFTDALKPLGHVFEAPGLQFEVVDLRPGRR
ncbi:MAG: endosome-associated ubiquitin isopeptidase [Lasallia pustulata]|uniref:Endosome-associated ubiquitin isopeptidase n=1 Tax=Lasallia pustulata TaxID=136370 RepID=A0A1W5D0H5_9LECA|nr:MAG: endosome-associated ubiquitin isopeptidase [Lasallia pustulata]SLM36561.1 USP8 dimerisation domain [Lasallia pustulata]